MRTLELFSGSKSFSQVAGKRGHEVFTSDYISEYDSDYCVDVMEFDYKKIPYIPDVIWASPPCTAFSVAAIGKNWNRDYTPKHERAELGLRIVAKTIEIIKYYQKLNPSLIYFIENPRGMLRKLPIMNEFNRNTVTYCQYGDTRMKPTDIWSNSQWTPRPMCKNGDPCHVSAPRGSRTGTQGLKTDYERSMIPSQLFEEIFDKLEGENEGV
ncbi:MAG: DNA cytosine methyltransferase [Proteobacteria bacterium]|jgi:site-specific DNA-cytosine methylase|nr:DNA cytosine methyltransferase [Pseudomonadota bacterium]